VNRREFIVGLGAAVMWPSAARAQQGGRFRRIGVLGSGMEEEAATRSSLAAFREKLQSLGWVDSINMQIVVRFGRGDPNRLDLLAQELVGSNPDVILVIAGPALSAILQRTRTIPVVMGVGPDPVPGGVMGSIARPEGNVTGFPALVPSIGGKWVELLKEIVPSLDGVGLIFYPDKLSPYFPSIEAAAAQSGMQTMRAPVRNAAEISQAVKLFAAQPNGGLILVPPLVSVAREAVIREAAAHRLPAMYYRRSEVIEGGLMSYGSDLVDLHRKAASYVDRILRGARVSDLPIQFPTKYELTINLKTAKALGLVIPEAFLFRADEVIE
jgi:putative ABC transport system substrate-binding protein